MAKSVLPNSVNKSINMKVLDDLLADRFADLDLSIVIMTMIDTAPAAALPYLAVEYGILGYRGWRYAATELQQREMLKIAYELHKYRGTVWAIKNALNMVGVIGNVIVKENLVITYDGLWNFDGYVYYGRHLAYFRVIISIANLNGIPLDDVKEVINAYKRETQWLLSVSYYVESNDALEITETFSVTEFPYP